MRRAGTVVAIVAAAGVSAVAAGGVLAATRSSYQRIAPSSSRAEGAGEDPHLGSETVSFTLDRGDFGFYDDRGRFVVEPGRIDAFGGDSSSADQSASFTVTG